MNKKSLIIFLTILVTMFPAYSAPEDYGGHAGTPPGFYDDIDPASLEDDEETKPQTQKKQSQEE